MHDPAQQGNPPVTVRYTVERSPTTSARTGTVEIPGAVLAGLAGREREDRILEALGHEVPLDALAGWAEE